MSVCCDCCVLSGRGLCDGLITRPEESYECLSVVSVVYCQVEVSATGWSLVQRNLTDCGPSLCVIYKPHAWGGHGPLGAVTPKTNICIYDYNIPQLIVILSHCISTYSPPQLTHVSYWVTFFSVPCPYQSGSLLSAILPQLFPNRVVFKFHHLMLLKG